MRLTEPVLITHRAAGLDGFGTRAGASMVVGTTESFGYLDEQAGTEEAGGDGQAVTWDGLLFLIPGVQVGPDDDVHVRGADWNVVGPPVRPRRPGASEHHVEVRLARNRPATDAD